MPKSNAGWLVSVPPRPIVSVDVSKAVEFFRHMCADGLEAEKVHLCPKPSNIIVPLPLPATSTHR